MEAPKKILLVKLSSIGDVVVATPVAESLRNAFSDAQVAWLVEERCKDVVMGNPHLDEVITFDRRGWLNDVITLWRLAKDVRERRFDVAIDLQGLARSSLLAYLSGAKTRIGFAGGREMSHLLYNVRVERPDRPHDIIRHDLLLEPLGIGADTVSSTMCFPLAKEDLTRADELLDSVGVSQGEAFAALAPATTRPNKHWVEERWASLADHMHHRFGLIPIFLGAGRDTTMIERIRSKAKAQTVSVAGSTTLKLAGALLKRATLAVGVDTGLTHISIALRTPTVGIFGPTHQWKRHAHRPNFRVVRKDFPCGPCRKKPTCDHFDCMLAVSVEDVIESAVELIASTD